MSKIRVLFFGALSEITGKQEEKFMISGDLESLVNQLKQKYSGLTETQFSIAVNQDVTKENLELSDGDEVALLPPFTGG